MINNIKIYIDLYESNHKIKLIINNYYMYIMLIYLHNIITNINTSNNDLKFWYIYKYDPI